MREMDIVWFQFPKSIKVKSAWPVTRFVISSFSEQFQMGKEKKILEWFNYWFYKMLLGSIEISAA